MGYLVLPLPEEARGVFALLIASGLFELNTPFARCCCSLAMARAFTVSSLDGASAVSAALRAAAAGDRIIPLLSLQSRVTQLCNKLRAPGLICSSSKHSNKNNHEIGVC